MKAWQVHAFGEPESMTLAEIPEPVPGPHQVRIRNRATTLNFFDVLQIQGKYQVKPPFPFTPGAEVAGVVDQVGPGVHNFKPGDHVLAMTHGGGFAECSLAKSASTFHVPASLDFVTAAAMPVVYHTSWFAFTHRTQIRPGEWLLVHAGASGVGMSAIQIGRALGARVIATAGSAGKIDFCRAQGAEHALDYSHVAWVDQVNELTGGRGADIIYDPVGGDIFDLSTRCIAPEGRLLVIGFAGGRIPTLALNRVLLKNITIVGVLWGGYVLAHPDYPAQVQYQLNELLTAGKLRPAVGGTWPLEKAPEALRALTERKVMGKAVLTVG